MPSVTDIRPKARRRTDSDQYAEKGIIASGAVATGDDPAKEAFARSGEIRRKQQQVWAYRDVVPELGHAVLFYENCFSRIRLTVAVEDDDGTRKPAFNEDGSEAVKGAAQALKFVRQLRSPIGGQSQLLRALGGCLGAVGEGHLVGHADPRMGAGQKAWEFLSPSEFFLPQTATVDDTTGRASEYHRIRVPGQPPQPIRDADVVRIWQPDRQYSLLPWAPALGMLEILDELVLLTREVAGAVRSRLALAGILLVADDIDFPQSEDAADDSDEMEPFTADLIRVASTAIRDKSNPAGVVPLVVRVPADRVGEAGADGKQGFRLLEFDRKWDDTAAAKRGECIIRFGQGIDLPVEVVTGHMSTTFANARQISADMYRLYIEPKALIGTDGLSTGYLWQQMGDNRFVVHPDATDLIVAPDQIGDWERAFDRFAVSFASYRNKLGASESDAPSSEEIALRLLLRARPAEVGGDIASTAITDNGQGAAADTAGRTPVDVPVDESASVQAAIEVNTRRALQRAGARLRSKVGANRALASLIAATPDEDVAATLGRDTVLTLASEAELLGREFDVLRGFITERFDRIVADEMCDEARQNAARRLFAPAAAR